MGHYLKALKKYGSAVVQMCDTVAAHTVAPLTYSAANLILAQTYRSAELVGVDVRFAAKLYSYATSNLSLIVKTIPKPRLLEQSSAPQHDTETVFRWVTAMLLACPTYWLSARAVDYINIALYYVTTFGAGVVQHHGTLMTVWKYQPLS